MRYYLNLKSSWAKAKRAKAHIDFLRDEVARESPNGKMLWLTRQYEPKKGAIVYRVERTVKIHDDWSLIIGETVHNLRGALDHLAWQLALRYFKGIEPSDKRVIKMIQFPIVEDKLLWPGHPNRKYMLIRDAQKLKGFQPFKLTKKQAAVGRHIFKDFFGFSGVSNVDKHRKIQVTHHYVLDARFNYTGSKDCVPANDSRAFNAEGMMLPGDATKAGDEVLRIPIVPTGPNPDVDLNPEFTGCIAIRGNINVIDALEKLFKSVVVVLGSLS